MTKQTSIPAEEADKLGKDLVWHVDHSNCDKTLILSLIAQGANVNYDDRGVRALSAAVYHGHLEVAGALIDAGASVNSASKDQPTPLIVAIKEKKIEMVKLLLQKGAAPSLPSPLKRDTPLHWAVIKGEVAAARLLLDHDAHLFAQGDTNNMTPLQQAKSLRKTELIEMLEAEPARRVQAAEAKERAEIAARAESITSVPKDATLKAPRLNIGGRGHRK